MLNFWKTRRTNSTPTLVVQYDTYRVRALIVRAVDNRVVIDAASDSLEPDPDMALTEALDRLNTRRLPRQAILMIPEAVQTIVGSMLDGTYMADGDVAEIIRVEVEARLSEQIGTRPIEEVLVERGYLSHGSVQQIRDAIARDQASSESHAPSLSNAKEKLGEYAQTFNLIERRELQECEMMHQRIQFEQMNDSEVDWQANPVPPSPARPQASWIAAGVRRSIRDQWIAAFEKRSIQLAAIYPLAGCAVASFDGFERIPNGAVVELHPGLISVSQISRGQTTELTVRYLSGQAPSADAIMEFVHGGMDQIWLAGTSEHLPAITEKLASQLGVNVRLAPVHLYHKTGSDERLVQAAHMVGAFRHFNGQSAELIVSSISTADLVRAKHRRPWIPTAAALLIAAGLIGVVDVWSQMSLASARQVLSATEEELASRKQGALRIEQMRAQLKTYAIDIKRLDDELAKVERHRRFVNNAVPLRQSLPAAVLKAVADAASPEIVINDIVDENWQTLRVSGWALSQVAAERFADALSTSLRPRQLELTEAPVIQTGTGRLGLDGYQFDLQFGASVVNQQKQKNTDRVATNL
ncbi:MAG: hypothetical protein CMJ21_00640 [Phycisphaerae bacterium]|nr:hypothetical protein [Phycisphaerae bacterium]